MPNHVTNEIVFTGITPEQRKAILAKVLNVKGEVDFGILLPPPLNIWLGNVSKKHEEAFPGTGLDWDRKNWGTKWNAYSMRPIEESDNSLRLIFDTAWNPPYGWIVAVFNFFKLPFAHNWMTEGDGIGKCGTFDPAALGTIGGDPWVEAVADPEMQKYIHKLKYGVESFADEEEAA